MTTGERGNDWRGDEKGIGQRKGEDPLYNI